MERHLFSVNWLRAANRMQELWCEALKENGFKASVLPLHCWFEPDFGLTAMEIVSKLRPDSFFKYEPILLSPFDEHGESVVTMILSGLFKQVGHRYDFFYSKVIER